MPRKAATRAGAKPASQPAQPAPDQPPPQPQDAQKLKEKERLQQEQKKKEIDDPEKNIPYYQRSSYGKVIIGADKQCRAVIDLDYVAYTALDLKG